MRKRMENESTLSRRSLLCGLAVLTLGLLPDTAIAAGNVKVLADGKIEVLITKNTALRKVGGVIQFKDGNGRSLALVRTSTAVNGFKALNLSCTHEGVTVGLSGGKWVCPEHRAEFALNGKVQVRPATRDLQSIAVKATKTKVTVG
jgi:Rieske Fe-S protein